MFSHSCLRNRIGTIHKPRYICFGIAVVLATAAPAQDHAVIGTWGVDLAGMDRSVLPGDDFDRFANGAWKARATIPPDRVNFGSFPNLRADADARSRAILDSLPSSVSTPSDQPGKLAALYHSFLNEAEVEAQGSRPLQQQFAAVRKARDKNEFASLMGKASAGLGASFVALEFGADHANGKGYQLDLSQGGLRLARDYYLDPSYAPKVAAYRDYAARLLTLAGWPQPQAGADQIVALECAIAAASWPEADTRDPVRTLNPINPGQLAGIAPGFPWGSFLAGASVDGGIHLNLATPGSLAKVAAIFANTPLPVLRTWLAFRIADNAAPYLSKTFVDARFAFQKAIGGPVTPLPRWKLGVALVNDDMGSALGELYVARWFKPDSKAAIEQLVENLRRAFATKIEAAEWMGPATRDEALRKLAALEVQVGRPREPIDYRGLVIKDDDLLGNVLRAHAFDWQRRVAEGHGPWNKSDWRFWPQYPTAYNENRQLIFTAAMLQPPFFDPKADAAANYGAIGAVIGHEITHNFDDQGRAIDADGRQRDWWTPADEARFNEQTRRLSAQFSTIEPLPGLHVNGDLTLGENIADLAGLSVALQAYRASLGNKPAPVIDGLTGDQRFFLSWAQAWREKDLPERLRNLILSDVHSPASARVNGPLRNIDAWYSAWKVDPGVKLYLAPPDRVRLW
jgi:putative endopeptidase